MPERKNVEKVIQEYAKNNFDIINNVYLYCNFFRQILNNQFEDEYIDKVLDKYYSEFGNYALMWKED